MAQHIKEEHSTQHNKIIDTAVGTYYRLKANRNHEYKKKRKTI